MCRWRTAKNYLAGLTVGDGSLTKYAKTHSYYIEVYEADKAFLEDVARELETLLKVNVKIMRPRQRNYYRLRISNKSLFMSLKDLIKKSLKFQQRLS